MSLIPSDLHPQKALPSATDPNQKRLVGPSQHQLIGSLLLFALFIGFGASVLNNNASEAQTAQVIDSLPAEEIEKTPDLSAFNNIVLEADSAVVWDARTNEVLFEKNPSKQRPLASLSKVMTALVASEIFEEGDSITAEAKDLVYDGIREGESWEIYDLIDYMLVVSSNDSARMIATAINDFGNDDSYFIDLMNEKANELGLVNTYYLNPSGLDVDEEDLSGTYGTALDMAKLYDYILNEKPDLFSATTEPKVSRTSLSGRTHRGDNTNEVVGDISGIVASKTGYTDLAGGNLVVAFDAGINQKYIIAVLGSSKDGRFSDVLKLHEATRKYVENN